MTFRNSVVGGDTLVRAAIQSPNFVTGVSGWTIRRDGSAEFNNVVIRGGVTVGGDFLMYDGVPGTGTLAFTISQNGGTDTYGNAYPSGLRSRWIAGDHRFFRIDKFGNISQGSDDWDNDQNLFIDSSGLGLSSPYDNTGTQDDPITMHFYPGDSDGSPRAVADVGAFLNSNDIDFRVYGTVQSTPVTTSSVGMLVNAPVGQTASLLSLRVNSDTQFSVDADGVITQDSNNTFTTYTPTVTGDGTATYSTQTGYWQRIGKKIFFTAYLVVNNAGSGATSISVSAPTSIDRSTRQVVHAHTEGLTAGNNGSGTALAFDTGTGATFDRIRNYQNGSITGADLQANGIITIEGWYREA